MSPQKKSVPTSCRIGVSIAIIILLSIGLGVGLYFALRDGAIANPKPAIRRTGVLIPCPRTPRQKVEFTPETCSRNGCQWVEYDSSENIPVKCLLKTAETPWKPSKLLQTNSSHTFRLSSSGMLFRGQPYLTSLLVQVTCRTKYQFTLKITDENNTKRYEVPQDALPVNASQEYPCSESDYDIQISFEGLAPTLTVVSQEKIVFKVVFDSSFIFCDQFIQATVALNSSTLYGFGEHNHRTLKHDMNYKTWAMFTRDVAPVDHWNLYGSQPFFMSLLSTSGQSMGVFLKNSNAMDVFLQPDPYPAVTYRVIGGVLDFHVFITSTPEGVVQEYTSVVGRSILPPYWSLGFQLSRWDYQNLDNVSRVVGRNNEAEIPLDVVYGDIDYMIEKLDFTYDTVNYAGLPKFVDDLKQNGTRYIIILDPGIGKHPNTTNKVPGGSYKPLQDGLQQDIFIKWKNGSNLEGVVWPGPVYFPDYTNPNTTDWWAAQIQEFYDNPRNQSYAGIHFDALWVDMNEVSNFKDGADAQSACDNGPWNAPVYIPENLLGDLLVDKTICMDSVQYWGRHYDVHSLYGHSMAQATYRALAKLFPSKRPLVLTRSTFAGTNRYAIHWLGDNQSQWIQMPWSIVAMLEFSHFGFSMTGSDICGFWFDASEELCQRWMLLGAFYPFARNHNGRGESGQPLFRDQDPAAFSEQMIRSSRQVLLTRYKLLPYLYTLLYQAHTEGSTVARPLFHEFFSDNVTHSIDRQFLWGAALLISPVMEKGQEMLQAYIPEGVWYDYYTLMRVSPSKAFHTFSTPLDKINLHVRGGYIVPWQEPGQNTDQSRKNPFGLLVALNSSGEAFGMLYNDDGDSADVIASRKYLLAKLSVKASVLRIVLENRGYNSTNMHLKTINVLGVPSVVTDVKLDGQRHTSFQYDTSTQRLMITTPSNFTYHTDHTVEWMFV